jgi:tetratricopeptide (TPR) repeat protein
VTEPQTEGPTFAPGEVIAGRYRISRFLGQGAVGEVYGATDLELGATVALKLLRDSPNGRERGLHSIERFKREILLARRVSHPNVCRIFDFGVHSTGEAGPGGSRRELAFLTMELLDGETLASRLEESGPLADDEVTRLAVQLCRGLAAAEAAGIVHRDLKSANILLVGERVVITDFGLARSERASADGGHLTEQGGLLGTPAYMSPEQVAGRPATAASDLYALGVLLYEAVTGSLPFSGATQLEVAVKRLNEPPTPIDTYRKELHPRLRHAIERCLARNPEDRFASASDLERYLDPPTRVLPEERTTAEPSPGGLRPRKENRLGRFVLALAGLALLGGFLAWQSSRTARPARPAPAATREAESAALAPRRSVAVLGLGNSAARAESQWIAAALAEMLTSEIAAGGEVRAVPGESVARARRDLGITAGETLAEPTLARLRRILGADYVLLGNYVALGGEPSPLRFDLRLQSTTGAPERTFSFEGEAGAIFDLARSAGLELRRALGVAGRSAPLPDVAAVLPTNAEAVRLYAEGLEALRSYETAGARELLERAVAADPAFPLARAALAEALVDLGYDEEAARAAAEAFRLSTSLARGDQLAIEALHRRLARDWPKAIEIARALRNFYPDDLEVGLKLAAVELDAGETREALATVDALRKIAPPAGEDPRIDLVEARAADLLSDYRRQLEVAGRAAERAHASGSRSILVRARYEKGQALRHLGNPVAAAVELEGSRALAAELGNRAEAASATQALAHLERARGDFGRAERLFQEAKATFAAIGNRRREARVELSLGLVASERGDLEAASRLYERARVTLAALGDRRGAAAAAANLGTMLYLRWDLDGAERRHEEALATFRELEDRSRELVAVANLAQIRRERGDLGGSERFWNDALAIARATGDRSGEAAARLGLGENREIEGEFAGARAELGRALELYRAAGELPGVGNVELALARIDREQGRFDAAAATLDRLAREFGERGEADDRLEADLEASRTALAGSGERDAAIRRARAAAAVANQSASAKLRHLGHLAAAEADLAAGDPGGARRELEASVAAAQKAGHEVALTEARLALLAVGGARSELARFAMELRAKGFGELAARAERLAKKAST